MLRRCFAYALLMFACLAGLAVDREQVSANIKVGDTTYKVVGRVVLANPVVFHKPQNPKGHSCVVGSATMDKNCAIPAGRPSHLILGCGGTISSFAETTAETFARVPGKDAPNLFVSIVAVHAATKQNDGKLEIAVLACGPRIAVPIVQGGAHENGSSYAFNRISLSVSGGKRVAEVVLQGIEMRPETYRIAGMNEAVLFVVPFKALDGLKIENEVGSDKAQTRSVDLLDGEFVLGSYSGRDNRDTKTAEREVVPAGHPPVRVIISSK